MIGSVIDERCVASRYSVIFGAGDTVGVVPFTANVSTSRMMWFFWNTIDSGNTSNLSSVGSFGTSGAASSAWLRCHGSPRLLYGASASLRSDARSRPFVLYDVVVPSGATSNKVAMKSPSVAVVDTQI